MNNAINTTKSDKISLFGSIKLTLLSWFLIFAIVPLSISSWVWYSHITSSMQKMSIVKLEMSSRMYKNFVENWFVYRTTDIKTWSQSKSTINFLKELKIEKKLFRKNINEFVKSNNYTRLVSKNDNDLKVLNREYDYIYDILLIDTDGDILYTLAQENDLGTNLNTGIYSTTKFAETYKKTLKNGKINFSDIERYLASDHEIAGFLTAPLIDDKGETLGVFAVQIKFDRIIDHFKSNDDFQNYIIGVDGYLRTEINSKNEILNIKIKTAQFDSFIKDKSQKVGSVLKYQDMLCKNVLGLYSKVDILGVKWAIISEVSQEYTLASSKELAGRVFGFLLIVIIIVIIIAMYNTYKIVKPIERLRKASILFSKGKRDIVVVADSKGEIGALTNAFNEMISSLNKNEEELKKQTIQAQEALKSKSEFLANMSHEIRTPMNGVLGMLGLLMNSKLTNNQQHQVYIAQSSANALLSLINDILDFSKVEAGKLDIESINFNLRNELGNLIEAISYKAQEKGVEIVLDTIDVDHVIIKSDPNRIRQILTNLVGNAIKFTKKGHVLVKAKLVKIDKQNARLVVEVIDTGIGIPEDKLHDLFESFTQVDASTTRKFGGTGLGLAIVERLCDLMDGHVEVSSELGVGSNFKIDIAVKLTPESLIVMPQVDIKGKRVLIVDDNEVNRKVLKGQLERWGMVSVGASDATEALKILEDIYNQNIIPPFDIAILDMQMPHIDGEELGNIIRANSNYDAMKLVMMTSLGFRGDATRYAEIGFNAFFPKPTTTNDLFHALNVLVEDADAFKNATPLVTSDYLGTLPAIDEITWPKDTKILLVEDNYTNQIVANGMLNSIGLNAITANNGLEALQIIDKATEESTPFTLIIMDCQMPEMDGYEATEMIRASKAGESNSKIPIIAMTANVMDGDREKCLIAGMSDYVSKPINPIKLKQVLKKWILNSDSIESDDDLVTVDLKSNDEFVLWNKKEALDRFSGSVDMLQKIINIFQSDIEVGINNLKNALDEKDFDSIKLYAHTIKGSAGNLSAHKLQHLAQMIESNVKEKKDIESFKSIYKELKECLAYTIDELKLYLEVNSKEDSNQLKLPTSEFKHSLVKLQKDIKNGEFIDTNSLDIFNVNMSNEINEKLKKLKQEVDSFEANSASILIDEILLNLGEE